MGVHRLGVLALLTMGCAACVPDDGGPDVVAGAYQRIIDAEDARPTDGSALESLLAATDLDDPLLRRVAVRALGRLENPALSDAIAGFLADPQPEVRAAAVSALARSVRGADADAEPVLDVLLSRLAEEQAPEVLGCGSRRPGLPDADRHGRRHHDAQLRHGQP
jgi:hypothetical protein